LAETDLGSYIKIVVNLGQTDEGKREAVGALLRDAQVNFSPQAADRDVTLALDLPTEPPEVMADRRRIGQVVGNLLTNALRHTPDEHHIQLL
jgi:signal transduction histidine kinase